MKAHAQLRFCIPVKAKNVRIEQGNIVGNWIAEDHMGPDDGAIVTKFLKAGKDERSIINFTSRYGPVVWEHPNVPADAPFRAIATMDEPFICPLRIWRSHRSQFEDSWKHLSGAGVVVDDSGVEHRLGKVSMKWQGAVFTDEDAVEMDIKGILIRPKCLATFMLLEMISAPTDRLRTCRNPNCPTPYFVATEDARTIYCSPDCAKYGTAQSKRNWWKESGPDWMRQQRRQRKRK